jgi:hypothetical protein
MNQQAATAARVDATACPKVDWRSADEQTLIRGVISGDDWAWLELTNRFESLLKARIKFRMSKVHPTLQSADLIEQIVCDIEETLRDGGKMRPLRAFDARHGSLSVWLCRLADHATMRRLLDVTTLDDGE